MFGFYFGICLNIIKCKNILATYQFFTYLKTIGILFLLYYIIIDYNPFYFLLLYWLPFPNLCRIFLFIKLLNIVINSYKIKNEELRTNQNDSTMYKVPSKRLALIIISILIFIKISMWIINDNYIHMFQSVPNKKYFICANLYNSDIILDDWTKQVKNLAEYLGKDNVHISIFENGDSNDTTASMLNKFEEELNNKQINNTINTTQYYYKQSYTRIPFLALLRNGAINPLYSLGWDLNQTQIIFLNDIIFSYTDILKLIKTNNNDYDMACGLDFYNVFYDTWISRGIDGDGFMRYFPQLIDKRAQRRVVNGDNIRVFCCWNGVASIRGSVMKDIQFRAHKNNDLASECSLLCVDMWVKGFNKIVVNPNLWFMYEYKYYYRHKYLYPMFVHRISYFWYYFKEFFRPEYEDFDNFTNDITLHPVLIDYMYNYMLG